jgi:hypothetical protein
MSGNRRVYRIIRMALKQMYPIEPKGNFARKLTTLAVLVSGIVLGRNCQLPSIARKAPNQAHADFGLALLDHFLTEHLPTPVTFTLLEPKSIR